MNRFVKKLTLILSLGFILGPFSFQSAYSQCVDPSNPPPTGDICGGEERKECCKSASDRKSYCCYDTSGKNIDDDIKDKSKTPDTGNCEVCK